MEAVKSKKSEKEKTGKGEKVEGIARIVYLSIISSTLYCGDWCSVDFAFLSSFLLLLLSFFGLSITPSVYRGIHNLSISSRRVPLMGISR